MNHSARAAECALPIPAPGGAEAITLSQAMLEVTALGRRFGPVAAVRDVGFGIARGQVTCLLGPSGCGKSTTLRMIAGIEMPDSGQVRLDGKIMSDAGIFVPPEARSIGMLFQAFALFPHLDVAANVGFGLRGSAALRRRRVGALLEQVGLQNHGAKFPHELSGGEQQRVALIRALAPEPCLMLLDEPFSSLDHRLRDGVRDATLDLLRDSRTTVLMVTHDPEEAMLLGDRIAVMRQGRVVQEDRPEALYDRPVDRGVAGFFSDLNVLTGRVAAGRVLTPLGSHAAPGLAEGSLAEVVIRPHHLVLDGAEGSTARVTRARYLGRDSLIELRLAGDVAIKCRIPGHCLPAAQTIIHIAPAAGKAMVFPVADP